MRMSYAGAGYPLTLLVFALFIVLPLLLTLLINIRYFTFAPVLKMPVDPQRHVKLPLSRLSHISNSHLIPIKCMHLSLFRGIY